MEGIINISPDNDNTLCDQDCEINISIGIGGDVAFNTGIGGSIGIGFYEEGFAGISLSGYLPEFPGWGIGIYLGIDLCIIRVCKLR